MRTSALPRVAVRCVVTDSSDRSRHQRSSCIMPADILPAAGPVPQLNSLISACAISSGVFRSRFSARTRSRIPAALSLNLRNSALVRLGPCPAIEYVEVHAPHRVQRFAQFGPVAAVAVVDDGGDGIGSGDEVAGPPTDPPRRQPTRRCRRGCGRGTRAARAGCRRAPTPPSSRCRPPAPRPVRCFGSCCCASATEDTTVTPNVCQPGGSARVVAVVVASAPC